MKQKNYVTESSTGSGIEIIRNINTEEVKYAIDPKTNKAVSYAQLEAYKEKLARDELGKKRKGKHYVNCFDEPIKKLYENTKGNELGALFFLIHYMQLEQDGLLIKKSKPMTIADISEILGKSIKQATRIMKKLIEANVIIKNGTTRATYSISKEYFIMGSFNNRGMFSRLYQMNSRKKLNKLSLEDANILLRILPWFHYQSYYLCANPSEAYAEDIKHLNETELAKIIGIDRTTLIRHLGRLMTQGYIIKIVGIGNAYVFKVNPDIMTREIDHNSLEAQVTRREFKEIANKYEKEEKGLF